MKQNDSIKKGSQAPTGLGRKTLAQVSREYNFDLELGLAKLTRKNIQAIPDMTFKEAAEMLGMSPIDLFEMMK